MSRLLVNDRPWVRFEPEDKAHRRYYATYLKNRCWKESPVRFYLESGFIDVVTMIEHKLSWYYLSQETKERLPQRSEHWITQ